MGQECFHLKGFRIPDFETEFREIHSDYLVVNADGNIPEKRAL
jgi:hypothetical protein